VHIPLVQIVPNLHFSKIKILPIKFVSFNFSFFCGHRFTLSKPNLVIIPIVAKKKNIYIYIYIYIYIFGSNLMDQYKFDKAKASIYHFINDYILYIIYMVVGDISHTNQI